MLWEFFFFSAPVPSDTPGLFFKPFIYDNNRMLTLCWFPHENGPDVYNILNNPWFPILFGAHTSVANIYGKLSSWTNLSF